jgi:hypothetical protein
LYTEIQAYCSLVRIWRLKKYSQKVTYCYIIVELVQFPYMCPLCAFLLWKPGNGAILGHQKVGYPRSEFMWGRKVWLDFWDNGISPQHDVQCAVIAVRLCLDIYRTVNGPLCFVKWWPCNKIHFNKFLLYFKMTREWITPVLHIYLDLLHDLRLPLNRNMGSYKINTLQFTPVMHVSGSPKSPTHAYLFQSELFGLRGGVQHDIKTKAFHFFHGFAALPAFFRKCWSPNVNGFGREQKTEDINWENRTIISEKRSQQKEHKSEVTNF